MNVVFVLSDRIQIVCRPKGSKTDVAIEESVEYGSNDERIASFERLISNRVQKGSLAILFGPRFATRYELANVPSKRKNARALKYACEEHIPLSAEQIETDVVDSSRLGVAIESGLLNGLLEICERHHVEVAHNGFVDLEAMQWLMNSGKLKESGTLVLGSENGISVFGIRNGKPASWDWFPELANEETTGTDSVPGVFFNFPSSIPGAIAPYFLVNTTQEVINLFSPEERHVVDAASTIEEMAARNAIAVTSGKIKPFISIQSETHRPQSYLSGALSMLVASIVLLLVSLSVYFWMAGSLYANQVIDIETELQILYKNAVPDGPTTALISRSLKARLADMEQDRSARELARSTPRIRQNLYRLLSAVPDDIEFELDSIGIRPQSIVLGGTVETIDDLVAFRTRLESAGFEISIRELRKQFNMSLTPPQLAEDLK